MKRFLMIAAVIILCSLLSGCEFFCACAWMLIVDRSGPYPDPQQSEAAPTPLQLWAGVFLDCANAEDTKEVDVCPFSGQWSPDDGVTFIACTPGAADPGVPSLAAEVPMSSSSGMDAVESAPFHLPQAAGPSIRMRFPRSPRTLDCTDPANAGRGSCYSTSRENKPLVPPGN